MYEDLRNVVLRMKAHEMALAGAYRATRQAEVSLAIIPPGKKPLPLSFTFKVCMGSCSKCDRAWIELRQSLAPVEVVQVRTPEASSPPKAVKLSD